MKHPELLLQFLQTGALSLNGLQCFYDDVDAKFTPLRMDGPPFLIRGGCDEHRMLKQPLDNSSNNEQNSRDKIHSIADEKVPFESVDATCFFVETLAVAPIFRLQ